MRQQGEFMQQNGVIAKLTNHVDKMRGASVNLRIKNEHLRGQHSYASRLRSCREYEPLWRSATLCSTIATMMSLLWNREYLTLVRSRSSSSSSSQPAWQSNPLGKLVTKSNRNQQKRPKWRLFTVHQCFYELLLF